MLRQTTGSPEGGSICIQFLLNQLHATEDRDTLQYHSQHNTVEEVTQSGRNWRWWRRKIYDLTLPLVGDYCRVNKENHKNVGLYLSEKDQHVGETPTLSLFEKIF